MHGWGMATHISVCVHASTKDEANGFLATSGRNEDKLTRVLRVLVCAGVVMYADCYRQAHRASGKKVCAAR